MTQSQPNLKPKNKLLVLGVDTSLRSTGLGLVEYEAGCIKGIGYDTIVNPQNMPLSACLTHIQSEISKAIAEFNPDVVAIEGFFFSKFAKTAMILGEARGVVIATAAAAGKPVYEHEPRRVKQAVAGYGGAVKEQMQQMVMRMLSLPKLPQNDAADALAIAICHIQSFIKLELEQIKPL